jgi:hypothetical protein
MKIIDEQPVTDELRATLAPSFGANPNPLILPNRRVFLTGVTFIGGGLIMPGSPIITSSANAQIADLIAAFIQGGINLLNTLVKWGEQIIAVFTIVNDTASKVEGNVRAAIQDIKNREERATKNLAAAVPAGIARTFQEDSFVPDASYGEGRYAYNLNTATTNASAGLRVVSDKPYN